MKPEKKLERDLRKDYGSNVYLSQGRGRIFRQLLAAEDELLAGDWDAGELSHLVQ